MEANIAYQIVTIVNGEREVVETVASLEAALVAQEGLPFPTRIMPLEVGFNVGSTPHLH